MTLANVAADPTEQHKSSVHRSAAFRHSQLIILVRYTTNAGSQDVVASCSRPQPHSSQLLVTCPAKSGQGNQTRAPLEIKIQLLVRWPERGLLMQYWSLSDGS